MPTDTERKQLEELFGRWSDDEQDGLPDGPGPTPVTPPRMPDPPHRAPPRVETMIQRDDAETRRKIRLLATPPPPPPIRHRRAGTTVLRQPPIARTAPTACAAASAAATPISAHGPRPRPTAPPPAPTQPRPAMERGATRLAYAVGPRPPQPVPVRVATGTLLRIPHHAVHQTRRHRIWTPEGLWILRFNADGTLRSSRLRRAATV